MFTLIQPAKVRFGSGCFADTSAEAAALGSRALVVCGRTAMRRSGNLQQLLDSLSSARVASFVFDRVDHDPTCDMVDEGAALAHRESCDMVIGLGGGSSLDAAKAIAIMAPHEGATEEYHDRQRGFTEPPLPFIAIPTTAGSGAEVTGNAVLTNATTRAKKSLRGQGMGAAVALVDPELTLSMPASLTAHTGMDAFTQAVECYLSRAAQPVSDALSIRPAGLLYANLPKAFEDGQALQHREPVMLGSLLAGLAFANAGLGAVHGLAHPIGSWADLPHGLTCAILLPHVLEFNYPACKGRLQDLAEAMGLGGGSDVVEAVRGLNERLGIPETFRDTPCSEELLPRILRDCRSNSMRNNPREMSDEDILNILRRMV